jgi:hypothetical protein
MGSWYASRWWCIRVAGETSKASSRGVPIQGWWVT